MDSLTLLLVGIGVDSKVDAFEGMSELTLVLSLNLALSVLLDAERMVGNVVISCVVVGDDEAWVCVIVGVTDTKLGNSSSGIVGSINGGPMLSVSPNGVFKPLRRSPFVNFSASLSSSSMESV